MNVRGSDPSRTLLDLRPLSKLAHLSQFRLTNRNGRAGQSNKALGVRAQIAALPSLTKLTLVGVSLHSPLGELLLLDQMRGVTDLTLVNMSRLSADGDAMAAAHTRIKMGLARCAMWKQLVVLTLEGVYPFRELVPHLMAHCSSLRLLRLRPWTVSFHYCSGGPQQELPFAYECAQLLSALPSLEIDLSLPSREGSAWTELRERWNTLVQLCASLGRAYGGRMRVSA
jgi:hypothetical protein